MKTPLWRFPGAARVPESLSLPSPTFFSNRNRIQLCSHGCFFCLSGCQSPCYFPPVVFMLITEFYHSVCIYSPHSFNSLSETVKIPECLWSFSLCAMISTTHYLACLIMPHGYSLIVLTDGHMVIFIQLGLSTDVCSHNYGGAEYSQVAVFALCANSVPPQWACWRGWHIRRGWHYWHPISTLTHKAL